MAFLTYYAQLKPNKVPTRTLSGPGMALSEAKACYNLNSRIKQECNFLILAKISTSGITSPAA